MHKKRSPGPLGQEWGHSTLPLPFLPQLGWGENRAQNTRLSAPPQASRFPQSPHHDISSRVQDLSRCPPCNKRDTNVKQNKNKKGGEGAGRVPSRAWARLFHFCGPPARQQAKNPYREFIPISNTVRPQTTFQTTVLGDSYWLLEPHEGIMFLLIFLQITSNTLYFSFPALSSCNFIFIPLGEFACLSPAIW